MAEQAPAHPNFLRRLWRHWYVKAFVISVTVLFAFYTIERQIGEHAWRNYQRAAKARGAKLLLTDYQRPPIPDEENYAATPLFQKILTAADPIADTEKVLGLPRFPPRATPSKRSEVHPLDLTNRQQGFVNARWIPAAGADPAADVLVAMERMEPALAEVRLASSRPKTRWPVDWREGAAAKVQFYGIVQNLSSAFGLRARALLAVDQQDEALSEVRHIIRADQSLAETPTMIAGLVRMAVWNTILEVCQQGIASNKWRDSDLQALAKEAESTNALATWKFALDSERGFGNQFFDKLVTADRSSFGNLAANWLSPGAKTTASSGLVWLVAPRGWVRHNQVEYNKLTDMDLEDIDAQNQRISSEFSRADKIVEERSQSDFLDVYYKLGSQSCIISFTGSKRAFALQSSLQQFRILCAAARYHHAHGELPETLDALVPKYLAEIPRDIMDGQPMRYRRTEKGGCLVWSIGMNRADDGGIERNPAVSGGTVKFDWVVEMPPIPVK